MKRGDLKNKIFNDETNICEKVKAIFHENTY
jgi:hypothetical protein